MPNITKGDRVRIVRPLSKRHDGEEGTVQWVAQSPKGQEAFGVRLDGDDYGRTFFPHEIEQIDE